MALGHLQEDWMLRERPVSSSGSTATDLGALDFSLFAYVRVIITGPTHRLVVKVKGDGTLNTWWSGQSPGQTKSSVHSVVEDDRGHRADRERQIASKPQANSDHVVTPGWSSV